MDLETNEMILQAKNAHEDDIIIFEGEEDVFDVEEEVVEEIEEVYEEVEEGEEDSAE